MEASGSQELSQLSTSESPNIARSSDLFERIKELCTKENTVELPSLLAEYQSAGSPDFNAWNWFRMLEDIGDVRKFHATLRWRMGRAQMLLGSLDNTQKLQVLDKAIAHLDRDLAPEDAENYAVIYQIVLQDPKLSVQSLEQKAPAFLTAASNGLTNVLAYMIHAIERDIEATAGATAEQIQNSVFQNLAVADKSGNTALGLAVQKCHEDVVSVLMTKAKQLAGREYLKINHIIPALQQGRKGIINRIINARPDWEESLPVLIVRELDGSRCKEMWESLHSHFEHHLGPTSRSDILHFAVQKNKTAIIEWLVRQCPDMVTREDQDGSIALFYNNHKAFARSDDERESIRNLIVPAIVKLHKPAKFQEYLLAADDTPRQASLDLTVFAASTHDFAHFIDIVKEDSRIHSGFVDKAGAACDLKFESVLRYVAFPDLSQGHKPPSQVKDREEVPLLLKWLRTKGVKTILKLVVPDCLWNPLHEDQVLECVRGFGVEELNWRRLDLCIETIAELSPTLSVLHLYSSGSWAALSHWMNKEGLVNLRNLKKLHLNIVADCMTSRQAEFCILRTNQKLRELGANFQWADKHPEVQKVPWSRNSITLDKSEQLTESVFEDVSSASQSIGIEGFISSYRTIQQTRIERKPGSSLKPLRSIKVALIDTGIVGVEDRRSLPAEFRPGQIKDGISFVHGKDGESETPWFVPSNEHGPQMAGIICSIDPYCELYTAKVADGRSIEAVESIVKAIDWAVKKGVDIISMSLVLFKGNKELYAAVNRAGKEDIAIICSTADQGNNHQKVYPAIYQKDYQVDCLIPVAACDKYGKLTDWSTTTEAKYNFRGKDVTAKPVRLMKGSKTHISGSSVATAIAAGTASLILACSLYALKEDEELVRRQRIEHFFTVMQTEEIRRLGLKYVEPSIIFDQAKIGGKAETYIKNIFSFNA